MHTDPVPPSLLRRLNQPHVVAYLLAGVALGLYGMGVTQQQGVRESIPAQRPCQAAGGV